MKNTLQKILGTLTWIIGIGMFAYAIVNSSWLASIIGFVCLIFGLASSSERRKK